MQDIDKFIDFLAKNISITFIKKQDGNRNTCMSILFDTIEAQRQEIEKLKATLADWKYNAKCDADHIAALTTDKDELVKVLKQARDAINGYSTCPYCWGVNEHAKGCKFYEALQNIDALIGGKEDV